MSITECVPLFIFSRYMSYACNLSLSNDQSLPEAKRKDRKDEALNILKAGIEANPSRCVDPSDLVALLTITCLVLF